MAIIFTAPDEYRPNIESLPFEDNPIKIFLAGSISGALDWQSATLKILEERLENDPVIIYNPRQEKFNMNSRVAAAQQIAWEFRHLEEMDIFTMYFAASETSVSPISLYELGRNICRMQMRFPTDWQRRILVDIEDGYLRQQDVIEQVDHATGYQVTPIHHSSPKLHAERIYYAVRNIERWW